jgi:GAF domain-containing protein
VTSSLAPAEQDVLRRVAAAADLDAALRAAVAGLAACSPRYHWVGVYVLDGDTLVLHNQVGKPTPHTRIPIAQGLCGAAARERRTIVVDDVRQDARYLACTLETRSEIVVPVLTASGRVFGEVDIDSDEPAAFGAPDRRLVEAVAVALAARVEAAHG